MTRPLTRSEYQILRPHLRLNGTKHTTEQVLELGKRLEATIEAGGFASEPALTEEQLHAWLYDLPRVGHDRFTVEDLGRALRRVNSLTIGVEIANLSSGKWTVRTPARTLITCASVPILARTLAALAYVNAGTEDVGVAHLLGDQQEKELADDDRR